MFLKGARSVFVGSPGKTGNHPDIRSLVSGSLNDMSERVGSESRWLSADIKVLRQRTIDRYHASSISRIVDIALTSQLCQFSEDPLNSASGQILAQYQAIAMLDPDSPQRWQPFSFSTLALEEMGSKPYLGFATNMDFFAAMTCVVSNPDIAAVRVEFADGRIAEDQLENNTLGVLVTHDSPPTWPSAAVVRFLDAAGREIVSGLQPVGMPALDSVW